MDPKMVCQICAMNDPARYHSCHGECELLALAKSRAHKRFSSIKTLSDERDKLRGE